MPRPAFSAPLVVALLTLAACGGGDSTSPPPANQVGVSGGVVTGVNGAVKLTIPAGAVSAPTTITVAPIADPANDPAVLKGRTYEFGPDGTQFAQPVTLELSYSAADLPAGVPKSMLRVAKYVDGAWMPIHEGVRIDSATGKVTGTIRSFSKYGVIVGGCGFNIGNGRFGGVVLAFSEPNASSCVYDTGRQVGTVGFGLQKGEMIDLTTTTSASAPLAAEFGVKQATADFANPMSGRVFVSAPVGRRVRLVSDGSLMQLYVLTAPNATGSVTVASSVGTPSHSCDTDTYVMPGVSFPVALNAQNSCKVNIQYPAVPQAMGKPLHAHYFGVRLEAGRSYTIAVSGLSSTFNPSLTIFRGGVVAQSGTGAPASRSVGVTPSTSGLYVIEVASGWFADWPSTNDWQTPSGTYTLSVQ